MKVLVKLLLSAPSSFLSHCFTLPPPSLCSHLSLCFFFSFYFVLAGYSFSSFGITELKPNSSLTWSQKGTTVYPEIVYSLYLCMYINVPAIDKYVRHSSSLSPPFASVTFLSVATCHATIPRLVLEWFVSYFLDTDNSFVTLTVRNVKHLLDSSSH